MTLGICVNARNALPSAAEVDALGLRHGWVRTIVYRFPELDAALSQLDARTRVCVVLNNECEGVGSAWHGWEKTVDAFAARFRGRVHAVEIGNELDLLGVPVEQAANLAIAAAPALRAAGMKVILSSVAGPNWVNYLGELAALTGATGAADYCCAHFYGQRVAGFPSGWGFGELSDAIRTANAVSGLPVALTELGIKIGDAGGEGGQAEYVRRAAVLLQATPAARVAFACFFAWSDQVGGPSERGASAFGLRRENGSARPAWQEFALANGAGVLPAEPARPPEFVLGFGDWHRLEPARLGEPITNERTVAPEWQVQATTTGILNWVAGKGLAFVEHSGRIYRWEPGWPAGREVGP